MVVLFFSFKKPEFVRDFELIFELAANYLKKLHGVMEVEKEIFKCLLVVSYYAYPLMRCHTHMIHFLKMLIVFFFF